MTNVAGPRHGVTPASDMKHVVALSGGKDSTAMALRLAEVEPRDYVYICTPTSNEPEAMFDHWRHLAELLGKPLTPIVAGTLKSVIADQRMIPNHRARFCTRILKIAPYAAWLAANAPAVSYVGIRADEEAREGGDYSAVPGVKMRFPMREWGWKLADVLAYLDSRGVVIPKRTDCKLCFWQRLDEWWDLWRDDPAGFAEGEAIEAERGATFRSPGRDTWPVSLTELRAEFERGSIPKKAAQPDLFEGLKCRVCRI